MDLSNRLLESLQARCDARRLQPTFDTEARPSKVPKLETPTWANANSACINLASSTLTKRLLPQATFSTGSQYASLLIAINAHPGAKQIRAPSSLTTNTLLSSNHVANKLLRASAPGVEQSPAAISSLLERCSVDDELGHVSVLTSRHSHDQRRYSQDDSGDEEVDLGLKAVIFQLL